MTPDLIELNAPPAPQPSWGARVNYSSTSDSKAGDRPIQPARDRDSELMLRVRDGDQGSFELLLEKHRGPMIHFLHRMVRNDAVAGELSQPGVLRVFRVGGSSGPGQDGRTGIALPGEAAGGAAGDSQLAAKAAGRGNDAQVRRDGVCADRERDRLFGVGGEVAAVSGL